MKNYHNAAVAIFFSLQLFLTFALAAAQQSQIQPVTESPTKLLEQLTDAKKTERQYELLVMLAAHGQDAAAALPIAQKMLDSPEPMVKAAALNVFISAMRPYQTVVPKLVEMINVLPRNRTDEELRGMAVAALAEVCTDSEVFKALLTQNDKKLRMTVSVALQDKPILSKTLADYFSWPPPEIAQNDKSVIVNGDFENGSGADIPGWELLLKDGATGNVRLTDDRCYSGKHALIIEKTNGKGYLELRSKELVTVPAKALWTWRGFYQAETAPADALLLFRLEDIKGAVSAHDDVPRPGWGWQSQSFLLNSPPGVWNKRMLVLLPASEERKFRMLVRIYGNPSKVWVDKLSFPSSSWQAYYSAAVPEPPAYTLEEASKILAKREDATAKLERDSYGRIKLQINGHPEIPVIYFPFRSEYGDYRKFEETGIRIHNVLLPINDYYSKFKSGKLEDPGLGPVWPSANNKNYNFKTLFNKLQNFIRKDPNAYVMLGFHITWPADYVKVNPGTAWQDEKGDYAYGNPLYMLGFKPSAQITEPMLRWPTPYSDQPFEDAAAVIRAFIKELRQTDISKSVVGCFVSGGHDGQFEVLRHDFGPQGVNAWRSWLRNRYRDDAALQSAWSNKSVGIEQAPVPVNIYEKTPAPTDSPIFYSPTSEQAARDYSLFRQERIWYLKEFLIKAIKEEFNKPLIGAVWLMGGFEGKYARTFMESKYLDIAVFQPLYQHRMPGMMTGSVIPFQSLELHNKMVFKELDFRTWIRETYNHELSSMKIGTPMSIEAFQSAGRKEIGQMLAHGSGGWWYFDISENAFNHPQVLAEIKRTNEIAQWMEKQPRRFQSEVMVVFNHAATTTTRMRNSKFRNEADWLLAYQMYSLKLSGVPFDTCFFEDLAATPELQNRRIYVFMNAYQLSNEEISFIDQKLKRNGKVLVWHYAPGYLNPDLHKYDAGRIRKVTGINAVTSTKPTNYRIHSTPQSGLSELQGLGDPFRSCFEVELAGKTMASQRFVIDDPAAQALAFYADNQTAAIATRDMGEWHSVYVAALAGFSGEFLHQLARKQQLYTLCEPNLAQTEMNGNFISISPMRNGTVTLNLPRQCKVTDAFTRDCLATDVRSVTLTVTAGATRWLLLE